MTIQDWNGTCPKCGKLMKMDSTIVMDGQGYHCGCGVTGDNDFFGQFHYRLPLGAKLILEEHGKNELSESTVVSVSEGSTVVCAWFNPTKLPDEICEQAEKALFEGDEKTLLKLGFTKVGSHLPTSE